jgi:guanosine-3',5'-bis(diphosphate) 3'-pyrophosphohydrolase
MLQKNTFESGHRGATLAFATKRVGSPRQQQYVLLVEALAVAAERRYRSRQTAPNAPGVEHAIQLVHILCNEAGITDDVTLSAAVLHDSGCDVRVAYHELRRHFGPVVAAVVAELAPDSPAAGGTEGAAAPAQPAMSHRARLITIALQILKIRDLARASADLTAEADQSARNDAKATVDALRGAHATLECLFDDEWELSATAAAEGVLTPVFGQRR